MGTVPIKLKKKATIDKYRRWEVAGMKKWEQAVDVYKTDSGWCVYSSIRGEVFLSASVFEHSYAGPFYHT